jgi:hypothetical protein
LRKGQRQQPGARSNIDDDMSRLWLGQLCDAVAQVTKAVATRDQLSTRDAGVPVLGRRKDA